MAARDKCLNIFNFNTQNSFKVTSVSSTFCDALYQRGKQSNEGGKGLLSAAFSGQSAALSLCGSQIGFLS